MTDDKDRFGMQIPLNPPDIDFDAGKIAYKIAVESVEDMDGAILSEICKFARESGVTTIVALNKKNIMDALGKATPKVPRRRDHSRTGDCPTCGYLVEDIDRYCSACGQRLDWEENTLEYY